MGKTTLVIMAAGIGSRYGGGIKQLAKVGPSDEVIIDYSIHDALKAGFNKIVFIIRKDIEKDFREIIGNKTEKLCEVEYVFQALEDIPEGFSVPEGRSKPWGTGQAILCCKDYVKEPFAVINADDYYGKKAFKVIHDFLSEHENTKGQYCMAGFVLENTLSENGTVTRGVCKVADGKLTYIEETTGLIKYDDVNCTSESGKLIPLKAYVSMNMWGITPDFMEELDKGFTEFLAEKGMKDIKAEYLLPRIIGDMLSRGEISVDVLETGDKWFGVTYAEDKDSVVKAFKKLVEEGIYTSPL